MTHHPFSSRRFARAHRAGFTLIELLTVIAIILVLAGLLLNVAGNANYKSSVARAQSEVKAMETALEGYKADNGTYPRNSDTDALNAQTATTDASAYQAAGRYLFQCLSGYTGGTTYNKRYMEFKPGQISTGNAAPSTTGTWVIDPFGLCYGYSTINQSVQDGVAAGTANQSALATSGYNPTFDLWSTAGYGSGGKSYPNGVAAANYNTLWAKNW